MGFMLNLENIYTSFIFGNEAVENEGIERFFRSSNVSGERKVHAKTGVL